MKENEKRPLISIIIPVYNSFKLMDKCLESFEKQSNRNFELIFIDDCSTDNSYEHLVEKLKKFSFSYNVVKNDKNSGPGITRNKGIEKSQSEYITFVDSDDFVSYDFVEELSNIISNNDYDAVIFDYFIKNTNKDKLRFGLPLDEGKIQALDAVALSNGMCWGKLYKKSVIIDNGIMFPNLIRSEDLAFCKVFLSKCQTIYYKRKALYYYTLNDTSIMHNSDTLNINNNIKAFEFIQENTSSNKAIEMIFIREYLYLVVQIMVIKKYKTKEIKKFIDKSFLMYSEWNSNPYIIYQPFYVKVLLKFIKYKIIFPLRMVFMLKK